MHDREHITDPEVLGRIRGIVGGAGRLGRADRALRWPALGCAMAVKALALIWELAQIDFLIMRHRSDTAGVGLVLSRPT